MLSHAEVVAYHDEGLAVLQAYRLSIPVVERLYDAVHALMLTNPRTPSDHLINVHLDRKPPFRPQRQLGFRSR